jgi:general secretion pathway protein B
MSYILEALKKAQAERQLGALPSIYTPPLHSAARSSGKPWWLALGAVLALLLLWLSWLQPWRTAPVPPPALVQAPEVIVTPKAAAAPDVARAPSVAAVARVAPAPEVEQRPKVAAVPKAAPEPEPERPSAPKVVAQVRADARPSGSASGSVSVTRQPVSVERAPAVASVVAPAVSPVSTPVQVAGAAEEVVPALRALPESIQRQIPALVLGGYIYSRNPQDRLLLIDKTLRREGEQVAPGLILETLRPTSAIFNYNGSRYQMAY